MAENITKSAIPADRLTRICDAMSKAFEEHPESTPKDRCIIMLTTDDEAGRGRGGMVTINYDDEPGALGADLFVQLRAVLRAHGKDLQIVGATSPGQRA